MTDLTAVRATLGRTGMVGYGRPCVATGAEPGAALARAGRAAPGMSKLGQTSTGMRKGGDPDPQ